MFLRAMFIVFVASLPAFAPAWGRDGHRMLAAMAETRLTTATLEMTHAILNGGDISSIASWSDSVRRDRPETGPWHYVNIEISKDAFEDSECPNGDCVALIIGRLEDKLKQPDLTPLEREETLKHLVHFVGDQAQPLHNAHEGDDRGGNGKKVNWFGRDSNLHSVWDSGFIAHELETRNVTALQMTEELNAEIRPEQIRLWQQGTPVDWTNEGHRVAIEFAYPGWKAELGDAYFEKGIGQVRLQLQRGAIRLAHVLNRTFDPAYTGDLRVLRPLELSESTDPPRTRVYGSEGTRGGTPSGKRGS